MPELSLETLELFLFFVVPGFVGLKTYGLLHPTKDDSVGQEVVELLAYSMINLAFMSWLILLTSGMWQEHPLLYYLGIIIIVFVSPAMLAFGWVYLQALLSEKGWILDPMPTAWDHFFSKKKTRWVLIHMKNGKKFGGFFGRSSHATAFPTPEDLYLEEVWRVDEGGRFLSRIDRTAGLLVRREECQRYCQKLWIGRDQAAAFRSSVSSRSICCPSVN